MCSGQSKSWNPPGCPSVFSVGLSFLSELLMQGVLKSSSIWKKTSLRTRYSPRLSPFRKGEEGRLDCDQR